MKKEYSMLSKGIFVWLLLMLAITTNYATANTAKVYNSTSYYVSYDAQDPTQYMLVMPDVHKIYTHKAGDVTHLNRVDASFTSFPTYDNGRLCFAPLHSGASRSFGVDKIAGKCFEVKFFYTQKEVVGDKTAFMLYYTTKSKLYEGLAGDSASFKVVREGSEVFNARSVTQEDYSEFVFDKASASMTIGKNDVVENATMSGVVNPLTGATITVSSLDGDALFTTTADANGRYTLQVDKNKLKRGFVIEATEGTLNGEDFNSTLRAMYSGAHALDQANVTLLTTLVSELTTSQNRSARDNTLLDKRDGVLQKLDDMGMIKKADWFTDTPSFVNMEHLKDNIKEMSYEKWLNGLIDDVNDNQLTIKFMKGFPEANGGVITLEIGDNKVLTAYAHDRIKKRVKLYLYDANSSNTYTYSLNNAPTGMTIDSNGTLDYTTVEDLNESSKIDVQIVITNEETMKSRVVPIVINLLASEVVASGTVGAEGGRVMNDWEDLVLTIPAGAVDGDSEFKVLRSVDTDGSYIYRTISSQPLKKLLRLKTPPHINHSNTNRNRSIIDVRDRTTNAQWTRWKDELWYADYLEVESISLMHADGVNRLRNDLLRNNYPAHDNLDIHKNIRTANLYTLCGTYNSYSSSICKDRNPVLFVNGFSSNFTAAYNNEGADAGGGEDTWGQFPELLLQEGYAVFEFTWKTNATFRDTADDLAEALRLIEIKTNKKVNIIAHSFGGLLSRTYIQNEARTTQYQNDIQSLFTLSTPHSGIFDEDTELKEIMFPEGQHSVSFEGCMQSSCNQAGEPTPYIYKIPSDLFANNEIDVSYELGVDKTAGTLVASLAKKFKDSGYEFKVPVKVIQAITIDRSILTMCDILGRGIYSYNEYPDISADKAEKGDQLISYDGQKFFPNNYISNTVSENIIGTDTLPGQFLPKDEAIYKVQPYTYPCGAIDYYNVDFNTYGFEGYRHSNSNMAQGSAGITTKGDIGIAFVPENGIIKNIFHENTEHQALIDAKSWLDNHHTEEFFPLTFDLHFKVVDADTQEPLANGAIVEVWFDNRPRGSILVGDDGIATLNVPFKANTKYTVIAGSTDNTYHTDTFDMGYTTRETPDSTSGDYPTIKLQKEELSKGNLGGKIIDAVNSNGISGVAVSITTERNNIPRETVTDSNGNYTFSDLPRGTYTVSISKDGYSSESYTVNVAPNVTNEGGGSLRAILSNQKLSIRLSWDENPRDLDSHLVKYDSAGNQKYHIYYSHSSDGTTGDNLDRDDVDSYGPETTTIQSVDTLAKYIFAVYQYAGSGSITSTSNAKIVLNYGGHDTIAPKFAPTTGEGRWWKVFEIVNGEVEFCVSDCILNDDSALNRSNIAPRWLTDIANESKIAK